MSTAHGIGAGAALTPFQVPGFQRLFVLGASRRNSITIYSQQRRALVLAHTLQQELSAGPPKTIAIVGGGIGGMMVARALGEVFEQCRIHLLERRHQLLHLLLGCRTRWLHPTINSWPDRSHASPSELPFFRWAADGGFAHEVATGWIREWDVYCGARSGIVTHTGITTMNPPQEHGPSVFLDAPGMGRAAFDLVVLAVGFGIESQFPGASSPSYWAVDSLEQESPRSMLGRRRILISGLGDGGLIDLNRARIRNFDHQRTLNEFIARATHLEPRLIDAAIRDEPGRLARSLRSQPGDVADQRLNDWLRDQLRQDTEATLIGDGIVPFASPSANINRALTIRLLECDPMGTNLIRGRLTHVEPRDGRYHVRTDSRTETLAFDDVIVRHGTESALQRDFPDIAELHTRHIRAAGRAADIDPGVADAALAYFDTRRPVVPALTTESVGDRVYRIAAKVDMRLSNPDLVATVRRIEPQADWGTPPATLPVSDETIAQHLADALDAKLPPVPRGVGDIERLHALVRLRLAATERESALEVFWGRVRGDEHRSIYQYGMYDGDRSLIEALLAAWPDPDLTRARLLNSAGFADLALGKLARARNELVEAAQLRHDHGEWGTEAVSRTNLAEALYLMGADELADQEIDSALQVLSNTSHLGLYRYAKSRKAVHGTGTMAKATAVELWRLPDPPSNNIYETVLANLSDARLFATVLRDLILPVERTAVANEALRYFGFKGPARRPCLVALDRAVVAFFAAHVNREFGLKVSSAPSLGEALWEIDRAGDQIWRARCELCAHRLAPAEFPAPNIPAEAVKLSRLSVTAASIAPFAT